MKKANGGFRAMEFEGILASTASENGVIDRKLYAIEGMSGIWRRVAWDRREEKGVVQAFFNGGLIALLHQQEIVGELAEAGFVPTPTQQFVSTAFELVNRLRALKTTLDELPEEVFASTFCDEVEDASRRSQDQAPSPSGSPNGFDHLENLSSATGLSEALPEHGVQQALFSEGRNESDVEETSEANTDEGTSETVASQDATSEAGAVEEAGEGTGAKRKRRGGK